MDRTLKLEMVKRRVRNFDLAKHLNCDPSKVSKIVNGWLTPDENTKRAIASYLKTPVRSLFPDE